MRELKRVRVLIIGSSLAILSSTYIFAYSNTFRPKRLYGKLEYTFLQENSDLTQMDSRSHIQRYELGYENYYYSPNLFKYDISGTLYFNHTTTSTNNGEDFTRNLRNLNYKAYLDFIQGSKFPFTLFAEKLDVPFVSLLSTNTIYSNQSITKYGIHGSLNLFDHSVKYYASTQDTKNEYITTDEKRKDTFYSVKISRNMEHSYYGLSLSHSIRDYSRTALSTNGVSRWKDDSTEVRADYTWRPSKVLNVRTYLKYYDSGYFDLKTSTASLDVSWRPTRKYSSNFGVIAENIKDSNASTDYISIYGGGNYNITDHLSTSHYFTLFNLHSDNFKQNSGSIKVGLAYRNKLGKYMTYYVEGDTEVKAERGANDKGDNYLLNKDSVAYNFGTGFSRKLNNINSTLNTNIRLYLYDSNIGEKINRYTLSSSILTRFSSSLVNSFSVNYSKVTRKYKYYKSVDNPSSDTEILTLTERVSYNKTLGINGKLNANIGIRYYISKSQNRANPFADMNLNYLLWRNLVFKANARVTNDLYSGNTDYTAFMGLDYRIRQLTFSTGVRYMDRLTDTDDQFGRPDTGYGRKNFYAQIRRVF